MQIQYCTKCKIKSKFSFQCLYENNEVDFPLTCSNSTANDEVEESNLVAIYESSNSCSISSENTVINVNWLHKTKSGFCQEINDETLNTTYFYAWSDAAIMLDCVNARCEECNIRMNGPVSVGVCISTSKRLSLKIGLNEGETDLKWPSLQVLNRQGVNVSNTFFAANNECGFQSNYGLTPTFVSVHSVQDQDEDEVAIIHYDCVTRNNSDSVILSKSLVSDGAYQEWHKWLLAVFMSIILSIIWHCCYKRYNDTVKQVFQVLVASCYHWNGSIMNNLESLRGACTLEHITAINKKKDYIEEGLMLLCAIFNFVLYVEWSNENPLFKMQHTIAKGADEASFNFSHNLDAVPAKEYINLIGSMMSYIHIAAAVFALGLSISQLLFGTKYLNLALRVFIISMPLSATLVALVVLTFGGSYVVDLVTLKVGGNLYQALTKAASGDDLTLALKTVKSALRISLFGISVTLLSFSMVFMFHGIGAGIYAGLLVSRLLPILFESMKNKENDAEKLNTNFLILVASLPPIFSFLPTVIWAQGNSEQSSLFLALIILIWLLPILFQLAELMASNLKKFERLNFLTKKPSLTTLKIAQFALFLGIFVVLTQRVLSSEIEHYSLKRFVQLEISLIFLCFFAATIFVFFHRQEDNSDGGRDSNEDNLTLDNINVNNDEADSAIEELEVESTLPSIVSIESTSCQSTAPMQRSHSNEDNAHFFALVNNWITERTERAEPEKYGNRIWGRRFCLITGTLLLTYVTSNAIQTSRNFSARRVIQKSLNYTGVAFTWPEDEESIFDAAFDLYNQVEWHKATILSVTTGFFWLSLITDCGSSNKYRLTLFKIGRVINMIALTLVFGIVIAASLPNYMEVIPVAEIVPLCGVKFNFLIRALVDFSLRLGLSGIFSYQLVLITYTIPPALVRCTLYVLHSMSGSTNESILVIFAILASGIAFPLTLLTLIMVHQFIRYIVNNVP